MAKKPGFMSVNTEVKTPSSWAMDSFSYDEKTQVLTIQMGILPPKHDGEVLRYGKVPPEVFREFEQAESKGRFFNTRIRNNFPFLGEN